MKIKNILLFALIALHTFVAAHDNIPLAGKTFLSPRSQSVNSARDLVGWHPHINRFNMNRVYGAFSVTPAFNRSTRPERIAESFFGTDYLTITGSQVANRDTDDLLADYFGLSPAYEGRAKLHPLMRTFLVDFGGYIGYKDFYFRIHAPVARVKTSFEIDEIITNDGSGTQFPAQYMSDAALDAPVNSFRKAIAGGITFGDVTKGLACAKINPCSMTETKIADLRAVLGWNFINHKRGHVGINIRAAAPTGNRSKAEYLFEPIAGNGHHWELGVGTSAKVTVWGDEEDYGIQELGLFIDVNISRLFKSRQRRVFDLCTPNTETLTFNDPCCPTNSCDKNMCCPTNFGSRYILVKEFDDNMIYTRRSQPLANITCLDCNVSVNLQFDMTVMFGYYRKGFTFDFGYNGWIRSRERIELCCGIPDRTYGYKGIQNVVTLVPSPDPTTQNTATLNGNAFADQAAEADAASPVFISTTDIDKSSAASTRAITHKLFSNIGYSWIDRFDNGRTVPFFGVGYEVEFQGNNERQERLPSKNTIGQWGVWAKAGLGF